MHCCTLPQTSPSSPILPVLHAPKYPPTPSPLPASVHHRPLETKGTQSSKSFTDDAAAPVPTNSFSPRASFPTTGVAACACACSGADACGACEACGAGSPKPTTMVPSASSEAPTRCRRVSRSSYASFRSCVVFVGWGGGASEYVKEHGLNWR